MFEHKKLDKRHTGYGYFKHAVSYRYLQSFYNGKQQFFLHRNWFWETYGPSKEIYDWLKDISKNAATAESHNEHWAWQNDEHECRIFLRTDAELAMFLLKWK